MVGYDKPTASAHVGAFNDSFGRKCRSRHWFLTPEDAQDTLNRWKDDDNSTRPTAAWRTVHPLGLRGRILGKKAETVGGTETGGGPIRWKKR